MPLKQYNLPIAPSRGAMDAMTFDASAVSSGLAFLVSELEKMDPLLREPLTSTTYPRDINIESGGGWVEATSAFNVEYGVTGGQADGVGGVQNNIRRIQADFSKDLYKVMPYEVAMSVKIQDQLRGAVTGRSIEQVYDDGIRLDFDKYMDINTYLGQSQYGTTGLVNDPNITAVSVAQGASKQTTWKSKTPEEILQDINNAILDAWKAAQYDNSAIPNHILIDPANFAYLNMTPLTVAGVQGGISIMKYLTENNIAAQKGVDLFIGECRFCEGAGSGSTNRLVAYRNEKRFVGMDVPVPMSRVMTQPNIQTASYDSLYMANVGQVKIHYYEPFIYRDGI
ncbi:DUF2184 domain-containing protein [uncultured Megasphaera sp.]|jgi:hypothetical protein|uniref:DUF2184 domain-containing protein n=1 Tax=uncultured Megasphaera sp. TaxID=165188 RepID=UPI00206EF6A4|nr:DUF2184 domain-containing protein [uncultured Megasphaera sp.]DAO88092.1 MAG TPA: major capsid protein [Caudoviricetes sp.]